MVHITIGMVFFADPSEADTIISDIQKQHNIKLLHVETSYGRLWISKKQQGGNHD